MSEIDPGCRSRVTSWMAIAILCSVALFMLMPERAQASADAEERFAVLVFSRTAGFRHDSIPAGIAAIQALGSQHGFDVDATEAPATFADQGLAKYRVVGSMGRRNTI